MSEAPAAFPIDPTQLSEDDKVYDDGKMSFTVASSLKDIHQYPFLFLQEHRKDYKSMAQQAVRGNYEVTELSQTFFCRKNIQYINALLKKEVFLATGKKIIIDDQPEEDILILMRATFLDYGRHLPNDLRRQLNELNYMVVKSALPDVITNIKQYYSYIRDITLPRPVLNLPVNVNSRGRRTLPSVTSLFF